eukprot:136319_1
MATQYEETCDDNKDIEDCDAAKRIKQILTKYNEQQSVGSFINTKMESGTYDNTKLLDDFFHIKYHHKVNTDNNAFNKMYKYIMIECDMKNCQTIRRHHRDRTMRGSITGKSRANNNRHTIDLISRIHTYFLHSYDVHKLSPNELTNIQQQLNEFTNDTKDTDNSKLEEKKLELMSQMMKLKLQKSLQIINAENNNNKFGDVDSDETENENNNVKIDFDAATDDITDNFVFMDTLNIDDNLKLFRVWCEEDEYDTDAMYADLLIPDDYSSNIRILFEDILPDKLTLYGLIKEKLKRYNIDEDTGFKDKRSDNKVNHHDILMTFCALTSANTYVAKHFLCATNPQWNIESAVDMFYMYDGDIKKLGNIDVEDVYETQEDEKGKDDNQKDIEINNADIYNRGINFLYWESMLTHKYYIKAKYDNLKDEVFNHLNCSVDIWNELVIMCESAMTCNYVKRLVSNGNDEKLYGLKNNEPFSEQHFYAIKLYTDFTKWCSMFCAAFRRGTDETIDSLKNKIGPVSNWARSLTEVVQCFGELIDGKSKFYRGVNREFTFTKLVARYNVPLSTSTKILAACNFADKGGLIMELCKYKNCDVFSFDCSVLSTYDHESENLFFGGNSILKMQTIYQINNGLENYQYYVEAIQGILNLKNGANIDTESISTNGKKLMRNIVKHILPTLDYGIKKLSNYIKKLLNYHLQNVPKQIEFNFNELVDNDIMKNILVKTSNSEKQKTLNIPNICHLFQNCDHIVIVMQDDYTMNNTFCTLLLEDIKNTSRDITLEFKWLSEMILHNKLKFDEFKHEFETNNCKIQCSENSIQIKINRAQFPIVKQITPANNPTKDDKEWISDKIIPNNVDRLEQSYFKRYLKLVKGYVRNVNNKMKLFHIISMDISNLITEFYPIYLTNTVWAIGQNKSGEFGVGDSKVRHQLILCDWSNNIEIDNIYRGVAVHIYKTISNEFYAAGMNRYGAAGIGNTDDIDSITKIDFFKDNNINDVCKVCSGPYGHSIVWITKTGKIYGSGYNNFGGGDDQIISTPFLINYFIENKLVVIDAATSLYYCLVLCDNGCVYSYFTKKCINGENGHGNSKQYNEWLKIKEFENEKIIQMALGSKFSLFVTSNGYVYSCGSNSRGQLGHGFITYAVDARLPRKIEYFKKNNIFTLKVACGHAFCLSLDKNGRIYTWGFGAFGQGGNGHTKDTHTPTIVESVRNEIFVDVECGAGYLYAITVNGDCFIWGKNNVYQCCVGNSSNENVLTPIKLNDFLPKNKIIKQIALGFYATSMVLSDSPEFKLKENEYNDENDSSQMKLYKIHKRPMDDSSDDEIDMQNNMSNNSTTKLYKIHKRPMDDSSDDD